MDDFYAECDDYLVAIRRALLKLEEIAGANVVDPQELEVVFRSFHSLKGISGMAGLQKAERVAHRAEDYLRAVTKHEGSVTAEGLDALTAVTRLLEQIIVAHREKHQAPDEAPVMQRLGELLGRSSTSDRVVPGDHGDPSVAWIAEAEREGRVIWFCQFAPSSELDERGINLNTVRPRLQRMGQVLQSTPRVQREGSIIFEFLVAGPPNADQMEDWADNGITLTRFDAEAIGRAQLGPRVSDSVEARPSVGQRAAAFVAPSHIVRVDLSRLDDLMRIMGELVLHRARLDELLGRVVDHLPTAEERALQDVNLAFTRELRHLREGLMRVRLVPVSEIFDRMPFVVRDLAQETGKKIRLVINGQDTEIDKYLVERLKDPLLHLVRNAISHGIEIAGHRAAIGKPEDGTISLRASTAGEMVVIEVADDGAGVDAEAVMRRARNAGLSGISASVGTQAPRDAALLDLLCTPGFSTKDQADLASGRGMGMATVRAAIFELGGELEMSSQLGQGTTFTLRVPLTLAIADALIIAAGGQRFAMPQAAVQEITIAQSADVRRLERNELMTYRSAVLPLIRLSTLFHLPEEKRSEFPVLVVGTGHRAVGIVADRVVGHREIVVRSINDPLLKVPAISGATELGDGRAVLILDSVALVRSANDQKRRANEVGVPASAGRTLKSPPVAELSRAAPAEAGLQREAVREKSV